MSTYKDRDVEHKKDNFVTALLKAPVLWGIIATCGFYYAIERGVYSHPLIDRYFASHPVEYMATTMFFVGFAALFFKGIHLLFQPRVSAEDLLGPFEPESVDADRCDLLIETFEGKRKSLPASALGDRIARGLQYVSRRHSTEGLDDHLHLLAEQAETRSSTSFSIVRIIISTIPILGFLGTVIGITRAVAELASLVGDISFETAINSVVSGLSVAFDTTALALALSIVLMFAMFFINRWETSRLAQTEDETQSALIGRFRTELRAEDPHLLALRQIGEEILVNNANLVDRQAHIWRQSIEEASGKWHGMATTTEKQLETALSRALQSSAQFHREQLEAAEAKSREERNEIASRLQAAADAGVSQQQELNRQTELMLSVAQATEQIIKLEQSLNHNLAALNNSRDFDQTIHSLTAAISLLNSRITSTNAPSKPVQLNRENAA